MLLREDDQWCLSSRVSKGATARRTFVCVVFDSNFTDLSIHHALFGNFLQHARATILERIQCRDLLVTSVRALRSIYQHPHICSKTRIYARKKSTYMCKKQHISFAHISAKTHIYVLNYNIYVQHISTKTNIYCTTYINQNQHMLAYKMNIYVGFFCTYMLTATRIYVHQWPYMWLRSPHICGIGYHIYAYLHSAYMCWYAHIWALVSHIYAVLSITYMFNSSAHICAHKNIYVICRITYTCLRG